MRFPKALSALFAVAAFLVSDLATVAQPPYPERAITVLVPFPAGGRTDLTARSIAEGLERHLGVDVVVVNKPGAGGVIGALSVAQAAPDGYTIGVLSSAVVATQYTVETGTSLSDYEVAGLVEISPAAIAVRVDSPWRSLADLVAAAEADPNGLHMAITAGASSNVFAGGFLDAAGIEMTLVPFKGDAPGITALAGGHVDSHSGVPASSTAMVESGELKILGIAAEERMEQFTGIPTFREQGVDLVIGSFHAVYLPKGTPEEVVDKVMGAVRETMAQPEVIEKMKNVGLGPTFRDRAGAAEFLARQDATYKALITKLGMLHASKQ